MKRLLLLLLTCSLLLPLAAQNKRGATSTARKSTATATTRKSATTARKTAAKPVDKKTILRNEQAATQKARKQSQAQLAQLNKNVKANLDSVLILDHQIGRSQQSIDSLNQAITLKRRFPQSENRLPAAYLRLFPFIPVSGHFPALFSPLPLVFSLRKMYSID